MCALYARVTLFRAKGLEDVEKFFSEQKFVSDGQEDTGSSIAFPAERRCAVTNAIR